MDPPAGYGFERYVLAVAAGIGAFPSRCVLVLPLPFLGDEAGDLGSAGEVEPIPVLMWFLL